MTSGIVRRFPAPQSRQDDASQQRSDSLGLTRRMRRNRKSDWSRRLIRESVLTTNDLIWPLFLVDSAQARSPVAWMPGVDRLNIDEAVRQAAHAAELGIPAIAPFPFVEKSLRDPTGSEALNARNLMCRAVRAIKAAVPQIGIICDAALDPYTSHGHDGVMEGERILNDASVRVLTQQALALADAGSGRDRPVRHDGRAHRLHPRRRSMRRASTQVQIMAYAAKYASAFYGPFRDAVGTNATLKGDKKTYQMDPANTERGHRAKSPSISRRARIW